MERSLKIEQLKKEEIKRRRQLEKNECKAFTLHNEILKKCPKEKKVRKNRPKYNYYMKEYQANVLYGNQEEECILTLNLESGKPNDSLLILNVGLNDFWTFGLFDTGCQLTLISQDFLEKSKAVPQQFEKSNISLVSINGKSKDNVLGKCTLNMKTVSDEGKVLEFPIECLIVKDLKNFPAILGLNTIKKCKFYAKMHEKCVYMNNDKISLHDYPGSESFPIFSTINVILPSKSKIEIQCTANDAEKNMSNVQYDESSFLKSNDIRISNVQTENMIELINDSDTDFPINKFRIIGFIHDVYSQDSKIYNMHIKLHEYYENRIMHNDRDFSDNAQARLPHLLPPEIEKWTLEDIKISGTKEEQEAIKKLCEEYKHIFAQSKLDVGLTTLMEHRIQIDTTKPIKNSKMIHHHGPSLLYARKCLDMWLEMGIIEPAQDPLIVSNLLLIPKAEAGSDQLVDRSKAGKLKEEQITSWRPVIDLRQTNALSICVQLPCAILPESIITQMRNKITSNFDLVNAFFNIKLEPESRRYCAFYFEKSKYQFVRLTQGLNSAPGALAKLLALMFQKSVFEKLKSQLKDEERKIIEKYKGFEDFLHYYFDDIWISTAGEIKEHLVCLKLLFGALEYGGVLLSPRKCTLYTSEVNVLGLTVQTMSGNILLDYKRGLSFITMQKPSSLYELSSRLSSLNYFRSFIPKLKEVCTIFYVMMKEGQFRWTEKEEFAWNRLRAILILDIKLTIPDPNEQLVVTTDASNLASSQCLWVLREEKLYLVSTSSKLFNSNQFLKPTHYKETMSLMYAMKTFYPYLLMSKRKAIFLTDARNLIVINRSRQHSILANSLCEYLSRMCLVLRFQIFSCPSSVNWMADLISRSLSSSRYIDKIRGEYTISKENLEKLPRIDFNINVSESVLLKMFSNEIEPLKHDKGRKEKNKSKTLQDTFKMYLDSTPEEAFLSSLLVLREVSRDLCNVKLENIGINLGELEMTLKDDYAQKQLLKRNDYPEEKSTLKRIINTIITQTMDDKFGKDFRPGDKTKIKNCLTENFLKMITEEETDDMNSDLALQRLNQYLDKKTEEAEVNLIFDASKEGNLITTNEENAGYDFVMPFRVELEPNERRLINSEVRIDIPRMHCGILFLRSSSFDKLRIWHGVIDSGYTGKIKFFLENISENRLILEKGGRYVQIVIFPLYKKNPVQKDFTKNTHRAEKGFGSTGIYTLSGQQEEEEEEEEEKELEWYKNMDQLLINIRKDFDNKNINMENINNLYKHARNATEDDCIYEKIGDSEEEDDTDKEDYTDAENENIYEELHFREETSEENSKTPKYINLDQEERLGYEHKPFPHYKPTATNVEPEKNKTVPTKNVSFSEGQLVQEIKYIDEEIKEKSRKNSFLNNFKTRILGSSNNSEELQEELEEQHFASSKDNIQSNDSEDSFSKYRTRKTSESDSEYESNNIMSEAKCNKFIECYTNIAEEIENSNISKHAIDAAKLSITFLTQDSIKLEDFIELQTTCETFSKHYKLPKNNFEKINGLLYHNGSGRRLCIPDILIINCIKYLHENYGHSSIDQTHKIFNRHFYYPAILKLIQIYVRNCITCVLCKWSFKNRKESDARTIRAHKPMDVISIDILPNLPKTRESYTCMLIMMDEFSTYLFSYPLKDRSVNEVIKQLKSFISTVGFPKYFRADQETSLISALSLISQNYPIQTIFSDAYQHQQNNVESGIGHFKKIMNKIIYDSENPRQKNEWYECMIQALNIVNLEIPSSCTCTRRELFYNMENTPPFFANIVSGDGKKNFLADKAVRSKEYEKDKSPVKKHSFNEHDIVLIRNHQPQTTGLSGSFRLKMSTDIYSVVSTPFGSNSIVVKDISTGKEKSVAAEDLQLIPIEDYFFLCKDLGLDKKIINEITKVTGSSPKNVVPEKDTKNTIDSLPKETESEGSFPTNTESKVNINKNTKNNLEEENTGNTISPVSTDQGKMVKFKNGYIDEDPARNRLMHSAERKDLKKKGNKLHSYNSDGGISSRLRSRRK